MRDVSYFKYENGKRVNVQIDKTVAAEAYKEFVSKNIREFNLRVKFNGSKELTSSDIASIRINSDLFTTDSFTIGSVVAETLELTIYMDTVFGTDDFGYVDGYVIDKEKPIVPYIALRTEVEVETPYGFELQEIWQEVNLGPFFINPDGINEDGIGIMSIRASTLFTHPTYSNRTLELVSKKDRSLDELIDLSYNIIKKKDRVYFYLLNDKSDLPDITAKYDNIADMTVREAINYIAILYGGYARTIYKDDNVYLEFFRKQQTDYVYDESDYIHLSRGGSGSGLKVTRIKCKTNDKNSILVGSGTDTNNTVYIECADMTQELLYDILTKFVNYNFRPTTTKIFGNPMLQVGDITTIRGRGINSKGDELPLHSVIYNITGSGVTMDIKSLFKVVEAEKKAKDEENNDDDNEQSFQERAEADLKELYDRTTIQEEDKDKNIPLITIKEDYLNTKESLTNSINDINSNYESLNKTVDNHIKNTGLHSGGSLSSDTLNVKTLNVYNNTNDIAGTLSSYYNTNRYLDIKAGTRMDMIVGSTTYLSLRQDSGTSVILEASKFDASTKTIIAAGGIIKGFPSNKLTIQEATFEDCIFPKSVGELSEQSEYTALLAECEPDENKTYISVSYDSDEIRWCWKETTFTYAESDIDPETDEWVYTGRYICYIELPIFMAENIENDYHINVSKMSWGDYRIIEKTPYYFILESQEDNFAFTFEVVAKLTDNDNQ